MLDTNADIMSFDVDSTGYSRKDWYVAKDIAHRYPDLDQNRILHDKFVINLGITEDKTFATQNQDTSTPTELEKKCDQRLSLLARAYANKQNSNNNRETQARIDIIEHTLDALSPRYTEEDWKALVQFQNAIEELKK